MSKGGQQTSTTGPDQFGNFARQQLWNQATQVASRPFQPYGGQTTAGPSDEYMRGLDTTHQLGDTYGGLTSNLGFGQQRATQDNLQPYMNPYQQNVTDAVHANFDRQRAMAGQGADQEATMAGAFGGSRGDILKAQGINDVNQNENSTLANLNQQGYQGAQNQFNIDRANANNLGFGGLQGLQGVAGSEGSAGQYMTGLGQNQLNSEQNQYNQGQQYPYQNLSTLSQLLGGMPTGGYSTQPTQGSPLAGAAGGALGGYGVGGMPGAIIGGIGGLFS